MRCTVEKISCCIGICFNDVLEIYVRIGGEMMGVALAHPAGADECNRMCHPRLLPVLERMKYL